MFGSDGSAHRTFFGLPSFDGEDVDIVIFGADTATPYPSVGAYCAQGAVAIRAATTDLAANLGHVNFDLGAPVLPRGVFAADGGDLHTEAGDAAGNRARIEAAVSRVVARGAVPVVLGGDDSLPIPVLRGLSGHCRELWVVQIDAHIDWRDDVGGERLGLSSPMRRASEMDHVTGLVQAGARGIGSARPDDLADAVGFGARIFPMRHLAANGIAAVLDSVPEGSDVMLAFDFDVLDSAAMPAVIARAPGGMDYWTALDLIDGVASRARIVAATFCEFMPSRDIDGQGARVAAGLVAAALGCIARARTGV
jgi:agmatinase